MNAPAYNYFVYAIAVELCIYISESMYAHRCMCIIILYVRSQWNYDSAPLMCVCQMIICRCECECECNCEPYFECHCSGALLHGYVFHEIWMQPTVSANLYLISNLYLILNDIAVELCLHMLDPHSDGFIEAKDYLGIPKVHACIHMCILLCRYAYIYVCVR